MGIPVNRIEKEFILKSLKEEKTIFTIYGNKWELQSRLVNYSDTELQFELLNGSKPPLNVHDEANIFFSFQNNHFTFYSSVRETTGSLLFIKQPEEIYKDAEREYRRIKLHDKTDISFLLKSRRYELNFPIFNISFQRETPGISKDFNSASITQLLQDFKEKMIKSVSEHRIHMMRDLPVTSYEEQLMAKTSKIIWIPSTEKDIPVLNPFPNDIMLTKFDLITYEEEQDIPEYNIEKHIKNFLFQKRIKGIHSEVFCPVIYKIYFAGYIYACNKDELKREISKELVEYIDQFSKVLSYSLEENGYFKTNMKVLKTSFKAPIIDLSASGLLFSHPSGELEKELNIFKELKIHLQLNGKKFALDSWVIRKFKDQNRFYFGIQFRKLNPEDFCYLYEYLYRKPFKPQGKYVW